MVQVPSNLIPIRVTELPEPQAYDPNGLIIYTQGGASYKIGLAALSGLLPLVSSVDASGGSTGMTFSGGPITSAGTLTLGGVLNVASGGTGATDAAAARANLSAAERGSNADITAMTALTGGLSTPDFVQLDTAAAASIAVGKVRWNADTGTAAFGIIDGTQEVNIGQQMYALVTNAEATQITKGRAVYLYQATGNRASVKLAYNTSDATSAKTFGLAAQNIAAGQTGFIITQGVLDKVNTSAFNEGDTLYLGATPGSYTATKPQAPNHLVYVGIVERANAGNGQIYVKPQNGYELDEIHDVRITSVQNNDLLQYYSAGPYWRNVAPSTVSIGTATNLAGGAAGSVPYQTGAGATTFLGVGTALQVLKVNAGATAPEWVSGAALTKVDDTNVTLTLGGAPSTSLLAATSLTLGWTGQLGLSRGGTNASLTAAAGAVAYSTASALALNTAGSSGDWLKSAGTGAPAWTAPAALTKTDDTNVTLTLGGSPSTALLNAASLTLGWTGQLAVGRGGTGAATFTANGVLYGNTAGALQVTAAGTTGQVLVGNTSAAPSWSAATSVAVTSLSFGTTGLTPSSATQGAVTVAGTLITTNGGTGLSAYTAGDLPYYAAGTALSKLAIGASTYLLTSSGSAPQWSAPSGITVGTATNAVNTGITDDTTTAATVYPTWVTANTGNLPQKVSSTKLTFNPSTGVLTATGGIGGGVF